MSDTQFRIHHTTVFDNLDDRQVEFDGEVDGDSYQFAVQHDVLEALSGEAVHDNAQALFHRHLDAVRPAALTALARDGDPARIIVSENDLP